MSSYTTVLRNTIAGVPWLNSARLVSGVSVQNVFAAVADSIDAAGAHTDDGDAALQAAIAAVSASIPTTFLAGQVNYATIADIAAVAIAAPVLYLRTGGRSTAGDGGGGLWKRSPAGSTNPTKTPDAAGTLFELVYEGYIDVRAVGATTATISLAGGIETVTGTDSAAAINAAVAFGNWVSGGSGDSNVRISGGGQTYIANAPLIGTASGLIFEGFVLTATSDVAFQPSAQWPNGLGIVSWTGGSGLLFRDIRVNCGGLRGLSLKASYITQPGFARAERFNARRWQGPNGGGHWCQGGSLTWIDCVSAQWTTSDPGVLDPGTRSGYGFAVMPYINGTTGGGCLFFGCQGNFGDCGLYVDANTANTLWVGGTLLNGVSDSIVVNADGSTTVTANPLVNAAGGRIYGNNVRISDLQLNSCGLWLYGKLPGGAYMFASQPAAGSTIAINGTPVTFVAGTPSGNQVQIGASLTATVANLVGFAAASADPGIAKSSYTAVGETFLVSAKDGAGPNAGPNVTISADSASGAAIVSGNTVMAFTAQPVAGSTIAINGTTVTFVAGTPAGNQVQIGASLAATIANLTLFAQASADPAISRGVYAVAKGAALTYSSLLAAPGTNPFTFAASTSSNAVMAGARSIAFNRLPAAGSTVTLNGTLVTFVAGVPTGNQVQIGATVAATVANLVAFANASNDTAIKKATFTASTLFLASGATTFTLAAGIGSNAIAGGTLGVGTNTIDARINGISMTSTYPSSTFPAAINLVTEVPNTSLKNFKLVQGERLSFGQLALNMATTGSGTFSGASAADLVAANAWTGDVSWSANGLLHFGGLKLIGGGLDLSNYTILNELKPGKTLQATDTPYTLQASDVGYVIYINQGATAFTVRAPNTLPAQPNALGDYEVILVPTGSAAATLIANTGAQMNGAAAGSVTLTNNRRNVMTVARNANGASAECFT